MTKSFITKCHGDGCPLKEQCYRHLAPSAEGGQQPFYTVTPGFEFNGKWHCDFYIRWIDPFEITTKPGDLT